MSGSAYCEFLVGMIPQCALLRGTWTAIFCTLPAMHASKRLNRLLDYGVYSDIMAVTNRGWRVAAFLPSEPVRALYPRGALPDRRILRNLPYTTANLSPANPAQGLDESSRLILKARTVLRKEVEPPGQSNFQYNPFLSHYPVHCSHNVMPSPDARYAILGCSLEPDHRVRAPHPHTEDNH